jgi:hypothetical protein
MIATGTRASLDAARRRAVAAKGRAPEELLSQRRGLFADVVDLFDVLPDELLDLGALDSDLGEGGHWRQGNGGAE